MLATWDDFANIDGPTFARGVTDRTAGPLFGRDKKSTITVDPSRSRKAAEGTAGPVRCCRRPGGRGEALYLGVSTVKPLPPWEPAQKSQR